MQGYKIHEVFFKEKKRIFREPTIRTFLNIKDKESAETLVKEILIEGSYEEFDKVFADLTIEKREEFYSTLMKELGLK
ncbi:hypothetical protein HXK74_01130 [Candidatus Gracilibacteria bacterium]|nr:hypothetical protein [Candidatus Gracilibacteria bacterium]